MAEGAQLADKNDHHPSWTNTFNTVNVTLKSDDIACISTFDIQLAQGMDYVFNLITK